MDVFDAAERYREDKIPLIALAGKDYGSGSSRDWAAKGPYLLVSIHLQQWCTIYLNVGNSEEWFDKVPQRVFETSIYLSGLVTAVAVFRNPNTIPFCLTTDLLLNVLFSWLLVHLPSTFFLDVLFFFFPLVSTP